MDKTSQYIVLQRFRKSSHEYVNESCIKCKEAKENPNHMQSHLISIQY